LTSTKDVLITAPKVDISGNTTAGSLSAEGGSIQHRGKATIQNNLSFSAPTVKQLGQTFARNTNIHAPQSYVDTSESRNEAVETLRLNAENNRGFNGFQSADSVYLTVRDMDLLDALNQTKSRVLEAHLTETDIDIRKNLTIDRTLHLRARRLDNKAKLTVNGDFIAHIQTMLMNRGIIEGNDVLLHARQVISKPIVDRKPVPGGYQDRPRGPVILRSFKGDLKIIADELLSLTGTEVDSARDLIFYSGGDEYWGATKLSSERRTGRKHHRVHEQTESHQKTQLKAGGNLINRVEGNGIREGFTARVGGKFDSLTQGTVTNKAVSNIRQITSETSKKKPFGGRTKTTRQETIITQEPNEIRAGTGIADPSIKDYRDQGSVMKTREGAIKLGSLEGNTHFTEVTKRVEKGKQKTSENMLIHSSQNKGSIHETKRIQNLQAPLGVEVLGNAIHVNIPRGYSLAQLSNGKGMEWLKGLQNNPKVKFHAVEELHKKWNQKTRTLSPAAAIILNVVITAATAGAGIATTVATLTGSTMLGAGATAGVSTLATQAVHALVASNGDPLKALEVMAQKENLCSLATSIATEAVLNGLGMPAHPRGIGQHLEQSLVRNGLQSVPSLAQGEDPGKVLRQAAVNVGVDTLGGWGAENIGHARATGKIDGVTQMVAHGGLAAGEGTIEAALTSQNIGDLAASRAVGAMVAEAVADVTKKPLGSREAAANAGRIATALVAPALKLDVVKADDAARNALYNNFLHPTPYAESEKVQQENAEALRELATTEIPGTNVTPIDLGVELVSLYPPLRILRTAGYGAQFIWRGIRWVRLGEKAVPIARVVEQSVKKPGQNIEAAILKKTPEALQAPTVPSKPALAPAPKPKPNVTGPNGNRPSFNPQAPQTAPPAAPAAQKAPQNSIQAPGSLPRETNTTKNVGGVKVKKGEQPWTVRPGQEYKNKIIGTGQKTQTDGHAQESYRQALEIAKRNDVEALMLNRGMNRMLPSGSKIKPNTRPDITYKTGDGKIHQVEVPSRSDRPVDLMQRMKRTNEQLPQEMQGTFRNEFIKEIKKW